VTLCNNTLNFCFEVLSPVFVFYKFRFKISDVMSDMFLAHNVQLVNVYSVVNITNGLFYQWYSINNKLHVSAIRWPSSGF
jgi:flagellar assembly factor FliW